MSLEKIGFTLTEGNRQKSSCWEGIAWRQEQDDYIFIHTQEAEGTGSGTNLFC